MDRGLLACIHAYAWEILSTLELLRLPMSELKSLKTYKNACPDPLIHHSLHKALHITHTAFARHSHNNSH